MPNQLLHASCVVIDGHAIVIRGDAQSGKTSLTLQLMDRGALLVADDQVMLCVEDERLMAKAPDNIHGLIEIYGVGVFSTKQVVQRPAPVAFEVVLSDEPVERLPEALAESQHLGVTITSLIQPARDASVAAKISFLAQLFQQEGDFNRVDVAKRPTEG